MVDLPHLIGPPYWDRLKKMDTRFIVIINNMKEVIYAKSSILKRENLTHCKTMEGRAGPLHLSGTSGIVPRGSRMDGDLP